MECLKQLDQGRQVFLNGLPQNVIIDEIITVNEAVTGGDDLRPWNLLMLLIGFGRDLCSCFSDELDEADKVQLQKAILAQFRSL